MPDASGNLTSPDNASHRSRMMRAFTGGGLLGFSSGLALGAFGKPKPWPVRAVIVTTYEPEEGAATLRGEFQLWAEREQLTEILDFPGGVHPLRTNADHTVLGMISGTTLVHATASMMALGLDTRFDLTRSYILINGLAGVDPHQASLGSVAWASFVVGDVSRELDAREMPSDWPYAVLPVGSAVPNPPSLPTVPWASSNLYPLNPGLAAWAFQQTRGLSLGDDPAVASFRAGYAGLPNAQRPPFVLMGDVLASNRFWHGALLTRHAQEWVSLHTGGRGRFLMSDMEDSGFLAALQRLHGVGRVDMDRVLLLRAASNYTMQRPGQDAAESMGALLIGRSLALGSAYRCGSAVLHQVLTRWDSMKSHIPGD